MSNDQLAFGDYLEIRSIKLIKFIFIPVFVYVLDFFYISHTACLCALQAYTRHTFL